jgi:LmbE family N-acetylglucosaminyl deacetylase
MAKPAQVMVVTPHPDDAEYGVAGTVARWAREGKDIIYVVCTNGDKGASDVNVKPEELTKIREQEQLGAARLLGVREVLFLRHPDQGLEDTSEFRKEIVRLIRMYQPEIVVTADPDLLEQDLHPHRVKEVLLWASEDPNYRSDITDTFYLKIAALRCHKSQIRQVPYPDLEKWLRERHEMMAEGENFELAEAFHRVEIFW